jgi:hypothetical protein
VIIVRRVLGAAITGSRAVAAVAVGFDAGLRAAVGAGRQAWLTDPRALDPREAGPAVLPDAALLIDLDNLPVRRSRLPDALAAFLREARPIRCTVAAGHPNRMTADVRGICADVGIQVLTVDGSPNAADRALLAAALRLYAAGVERWWVVSHDAAFSLLPGHITVLSTGAGRPARALVNVAAEIRQVQVQ